MRGIILQLFRDIGRKARNIYRVNRIRVWICVAAFAVSFGYALFYQITPSVDARKFHEIAVHLATQGTFCFECNVPLAKDTAIRDIGPGYQFFLAGVYRVFGIHLWIVWFLQALMHAVVVWWVWDLLEMIVPTEKRRSWMFALPLMLFAIHPDIVQNNAMLMADGLFTFLLVGSVRVFLPYLERVAPQNWKRPVLFGAFTGVLAMIKPTGLPIFIVMLAAFAWRRFWKPLLIAAIVFVAVQTPWAIRNARIYDHFVYNSVVGGLDIWVGLNPNGTGEFNPAALPDIKQRIKNLAPDEIDRVSMTEVRRIIRERPLFALQRTASKFFKLFALSKTSAFWFHYKGAWDRLVVLVGSVIFNLALLGMFFASLWDACIRRKFHHWILALCTVLVILLAIPPTFTVVVNRYRIPMLPFMAVVSAGWLAFVQHRDRRNSLIAAIIVLCVATGVDVWGSWGKLIDRISQFRT